MGSGAVAQTLGPLRRDGDLIPFSMTLGLLPILARIVAYLILKTVLLLIVVVSVLLVSRFGHRRVLPLISVTLMPRVGGLGIKFFSGSHVGINEGAFGPASLKRDRNPLQSRA